MFVPRDGPEASWADKHRGAMLRQCLGALSPEHRTIIDLVYYHEKSVQEVAAIVGIPRAPRSKPGCPTRARSSLPCSPRKG
jgi:DNA-directed RNA polymerase specialized sigma24 family protein